jgi:tRNA (guanosine-2'-O-)-methyltransferase
MNKQLIEFFETFVNPNRVTLLNNRLNDRTNYLTVVLEDVFQPQNVSAVLRTCECFGIQDVHVVEERNAYRVNPDIVLGAEQWLSLYKYGGTENNTEFALKTLKDKGYRIIATSPHRNDVDLHNFNLQNGKAALVFGTELTGISDTVHKYADEYLKIPMYGFTESLNVSVSAAIIIQYLTNKLRETDIEWRLTEQEKQTLKLLWLKNSIRKPNIIEKYFFKNIIKSEISDK